MRESMCAYTMIIAARCAGGPSKKRTYRHFGMFLAHVLAQMVGAFGPMAAHRAHHALALAALLAQMATQRAVSAIGAKALRTLVILFGILMQLIGRTQRKAAGVESINAFDCVITVVVSVSFFGWIIWEYVTIVVIYEYVHGG